MATISSISLAQDGAFTVSLSTLTASDTITVSGNQYTIFHNDTGCLLKVVV